MKNYSNSSGIFAPFGGLVVLGFFLFFIFLPSIIGAFAVPYTINTWLVFVGKQPAVVWWMGLLICLIPGAGYLSVLTSIITWILMLFL
jgi:hypothetical protein